MGARNGTSLPPTHLRVEELIALVGTRATTQLCLRYGGRRIPAPRRFRSWGRARLIVGDFFKGYTVRDLAARYQASVSTIRRILTQAERIGRFPRRSAER